MLVSDMTIKSNHRHVDMQGLVFLPYLHEWKQDSNLVGLVEITSNVFSIEPPLFSKPAASAVTPAVTYPSYSNTASMGSGKNFVVLMLNCSVLVIHNSRCVWRGDGSKRLPRHVRYTHFLCRDVFIAVRWGDTRHRHACR